MTTNRYILVNRWYSDDELDGLAVGLEGQIYAPTHCPITDAVIGSHVAGRIPPAQHYGFRLQCHLREQEWLRRYEDRLAGVEVEPF